MDGWMVIQTYPPPPQTPQRQSQHQNNQYTQTRTHRSSACRKSATCGGSSRNTAVLAAVRSSPTPPAVTPMSATRHSFLVLLIGRRMCVRVCFVRERAGRGLTSLPSQPHKQTETNTTMHSWENTQKRIPELVDAFLPLLGARAALDAHHLPPPRQPPLLPVPA